MDYKVKLHLVNGEQIEAVFEAMNIEELKEIIFMGVIDIELKGVLTFIPENAIVKVEVL